MYHYMIFICLAMHSWATIFLSVYSQTLQHLPSFLSFCRIVLNLVQHERFKSMTPSPPSLHHHRLMSNLTLAYCHHTMVRNIVVTKRIVILHQVNVIRKTSSTVWMVILPITIPRRALKPAVANAVAVSEHVRDSRDMSAKIRLVVWESKHV